MGNTEAYMNNTGKATIYPNPNFNANKAAEGIKKAIAGFGTDESALIKILAQHSNAQRQEIAAVYKQSYGKDLIKDLKDECSGKFEDVLVAMVMSRPVYDAHLLRQAMKGVGTDEEVLIEVLGIKSNEDIHYLKATYEKEFKRNLEKDIISETSGHFRKLLVSLLTGNREVVNHVDDNAVKEDAQKLYNAGEACFGTDESEFNRVLCRRDVRHLKALMKTYENMFGKSLENVIKSETSGDIRDGYLAILKYVRDSNEYFAELLYKSMKGLGTNDKQLIRTIVNRSEMDLGDISAKFQQMYGKSLVSWVKDDLSGDYEKTILAILNPGGGH